ncbi:sugar transferase [Pseudooceanicola sediminis]|uniref:Sugar transferase n=1 Tax=Pseudooceanicola sediminis TaxID=2211117 RepID=A0A399J7R6_9RHOB|nr:sugar transferase [Pseudooceanicola sediminis]KAA2315527.1 sugar transferase [Puniceibacterium sp. HSS470]RII40269.1 sugar transferase [Pseudooceanicola sediminis]|tara:strand:+ start:67840 stop:68604 length:765 start_codon:yes stop_codon:yes gene_type:complete
MTPAKRLMDLALALLALALLWPVLLGIALWIRLRDGGPVLHVSERMKTPQTAFALVKFRTMAPDPHDSGVSGGDKACRVTATGRWLRRTRIDELPQLWNILRGDMSLVGPRPPLRQYVDQFPLLYAQVLTCRPGVTGLATLEFHGREDALLRACTSAEQTERIYVRRCIPAKARLDLIYLRRRSIGLDLLLILRTLNRRVPLRRPPRRPVRSANSTTSERSTSSATIPGIRASATIPCRAAPASAPRPGRRPSE